MIRLETYENNNADCFDLLSRIDRDVTIRTYGNIRQVDVLGYQVNVDCEDPQRALREAICELAIEIMEVENEDALLVQA